MQHNSTPTSSGDHFHLPIITITLGTLAFWVVAIINWQDYPLIATFDDSFYYFTIARNWVKGLGFTFDGLSQTNGFHPLWLILCAIPYLLSFSDMEAVRVLLLFQVALAALSIIIVGKALAALRPERRGPGVIPLLTLLGITMSPMTMRFAVNGLESTLVLFFLSIALWIHSVKSFELQSIPKATEVAGRSPGGTTNTARRISGERSAFDDETGNVICGQYTQSPSWRFALGACFALLFLSRTDAGLLIPCYLIWWWTTKAGTVRQLLEILILPVLVIALFLVTNWLLFDTPVQVSGVVKQIPRTPRRIVLFAGCFGAFAFGWYRATQQVRFATLQRMANTFGWLYLFAGTIFGYYLFLQSFPRLWHFVPVFTCLVLTYFALTMDFANLLLNQQFQNANQRRRQTLLISTIFAVPVLWLITTSWTSVLNSNSYSIRKVNYEAALWINKQIDPNDIIASWDAGIVGYFSKNRVINLDGVVNSAQYARAIRTGSTAELLEHYPIRWIFNHHYSEIDTASFIKQAEGVLGPRANHIILRKSWPFTFHGAFNNKPIRTWHGAVLLFQLPNDGTETSLQ
ncbi:MAG: hypothetical protein KDD70_00060 [Bdellovibrionales bacterium]|nr:hypothetical protein [Bdellovibrionales bacterium]